MREVTTKMDENFSNYSPKSLSFCLASNMGVKARLSKRTMKNTCIAGCKLSNWSSDGQVKKEWASIGANTFVYSMNA